MELKEIVYSFGRFQRHHVSQIRQIMENEGLFYGQLPILECVLKKGCCTQREIVEDLEISAPSVATSVKRLVKKGYLEKSISEKDQRVTLISVTELGKEKTQICRNKFNALDQKVFSVLSEDEREMLQDMMQRLIHQLKEE